MTGHLGDRRSAQAKIEMCEIAGQALSPIIALRELAEQQVADLRAQLHDKIHSWRDRIYRKTQSHTPDLVSAAATPKGTLQILVGIDGVRAPAQHVANGSAMRASLMGFFLAFWQFVYETRGGLTFLALDDPHDLFDQENQERLADAIPELIKVGAQLLVTTSERSFARQTMAAARRASLAAVTHRSVFPVSDVSPCARLPCAGDDLERKRNLYSSDFNRDCPVPAQDYIEEMRIFLEARLAEMLGESLRTPTSACTLGDLVGRLRGKVRSGASDFFRFPVVKGLSNHEALDDGSLCLRLLNRAHHKDKDTITYLDVKGVQSELDSLQEQVLGAAEELHRWLRREPEMPVDRPVITLTPMTRPQFDVQVFPDLAALSSEPQVALTANDEILTGDWFTGKTLYRLDCHNFGFAAPIGSIVVVDANESQAKDRELVIVHHQGRVRARRLFAGQHSLDGKVTLAAEATDPRKSPPSLSLRLTEVQLHKVVGILLDERPFRPSVRDEAVQVAEASVLRRVKVAFLVRDESALPLALPGQIVLGGPLLSPRDLAAHEGRLLAVGFNNGAYALKRLGGALPDELSHVVQLESVGGRGNSLLAMLESVEGRSGAFPLIVAARSILGVLYHQ
jgi:hypothetical protein